jgi:drug/metabolite transporter (DMT)-like permease
MDTFPLIMVLIAAVLHAGWNALVKSGGSPWFRMGLVMGSGSIFTAPFLPLLPLPSAEIWPLLLLSTGVHQIYFCGVCLGYRVGDLSHVYPVQRGIAPVLVAIGAYVFVGEKLNIQGMAGVGLICLAILSLAIHTGKRAANGRALWFALMTGTCIATYSVIDGMAVHGNPNVYSYILWLIFLGGLPFGTLAIVLAWKKDWVEIRKHLAKGTLGGVFTSVAYGLVIWAMSLAPITYVSALRETSVIVAAWIGSRLLGEPFGGRRILAASMVAGGVIVLHTSSLA